MTGEKRVVRSGGGRALLIVWNAVAMVLLIALWVYAARVVPLAGASRITTLDRAGVINEEALREHFPQLAENMRYNLGMWTEAPGRSAAVKTAMLGTFVVAGNLAIVAGFMFAAKRSR